MNFYLVNFGCKTNRYDAVTLTLPLHGNGHKEVATAVEADLILINTCTVTKRSDAKARASIRHLNRVNPKASIVVSGCSVETQGDLISSLPGVELTVGVNEHSKLQRFMESRYRNGGNGNSDRWKTEGREYDSWIDGVDMFPGRSRAYLKIQDGCDNRCTYCVIPRIRGSNRSRYPKDIVREAQRLLLAGHTELVLTGIHIGHYGKDLINSTKLVELIRILLDETDMTILRLGSLNSDEVDEKLIQLMASDQRIARHLHIPLQSGSDRVLAAMARSYRSAGFDKVVRLAREHMPLINIGSDVIVGFPTEGRAEFDETYRLIEKLPIGYLHVFRYSDRTGTKASSLRRCATTEEVKERAGEMKRLGRSKRDAFHRAMVGKRLMAVYEREAEDGDSIYRSTNYLKLYTTELVTDGYPASLEVEGLYLDGLRASISASTAGSCFNE
jgi:threonylcarbamoyladenosine tRNA methylthiotransferase MtaB